MNLSVYLITYLKSLEYYNQKLLGTTHFNTIIDLSGTTDEYLYGVKKIEYDFNNESRFYTKLDEYVELNNLYSSLNFNYVKIYADVELLSYRLSNILGLKNSCVPLKFEIVSNRLDENVEIYLPCEDTSIKDIDISVDISKYKWNPSNVEINDLEELRKFESLGGKKESIYLIYDMYEDDFAEFRDFYEACYKSEMNIIFTVRNTSTVYMEALYNTFKSFSERKPNKFLALNKEYYKTCSFGAYDYNVLLYDKYFELFDAILH
jgi:hypothetical protein